MDLLCHTRTIEHSKMSDYESEVTIQNKPEPEENSAEISSQPTTTQATVNSEHFEALMNNICQMAKTFQHGSKSSTPRFSIDSFAGLLTEDANLWLDKFDAWIAFHGWNKENEKIASAMRLKLEGGALSWFNGLRISEKRKSDQLFKKFKDHFSGHHPTWMLEQHLYERCMLPSQSSKSTLVTLSNGVAVCAKQTGRVQPHSSEDYLDRYVCLRQLVAQTDVTLPPRSEKLIVAKIKGTRRPVLASHSLLAAKSLSEVRNGTVAHGLCNLTDKPITIKKNSNVGKFVCLSDKYKVFVVNESKTSASVQNTPIEDEGAVMNEILSHIGRDLNDKERDQLVNLLENYSNVFVNGGNLGKCDTLQHEISMPCD
ncbi:unnamed protein product [Mytilus coruscus]|uniref:Retrotransposon gag domain-containing protein n=1 Tax=Mytilus coruscus TaxID=42192 RepID=A0A6J8DEQ7_MYTCO|nr:unnamed protein product [Mytilus coruscus]